MTTGTIACFVCGGSFEATAFDPPVRPSPLLEMATAGPEGTNQCANHARNAAVTSCQRCGLFICALCDLDLGSGSYCPSCFERLRAEGTLQPAAKKYRDYAGMARVSVLAGVLLTFIFLGAPAGALAVYYGIRAVRQRRAEGGSVVWPVIAIIVGVVEFVAGGMYLAFFLWAMFRMPTT